mmetsp:Transcript_4990/g.15039  ORF Transcript_4990/g.15039 Transcript_4990/m.15039 type:complete len:265 (+) Transcript_4990:415-1209(+)
MQQLVSLPQSYEGGVRVVREEEVSVDDEDVARPSPFNLVVAQLQPKQQSNSVGTVVENDGLPIPDLDTTLVLPSAPAADGHQQAVDALSTPDLGACLREELVACSRETPLVERSVGMRAPQPELLQANHIEQFSAVLRQQMVEDGSMPRGPLLFAEVGLAAAFAHALVGGAEDVPGSHAEFAPLTTQCPQECSAEPPKSTPPPAEITDRHNSSASAGEVRLGGARGTATPARRRTGAERTNKIRKVNRGHMSLDARHGSSARRK